VPEPAAPEVVDIPQEPVHGSDPETGSQGTSAEEPEWTRAVSFARKPEPEVVPEPPALEAVDAPVEEVPSAGEATWTRAVSFAPSSEPEVVHEPPALEAVDAPVEEVPSAGEATWTRAVSFAPSSEPEAVVEPPAPETVDATVEETMAAGPIAGEPVVAEPVAPPAPEPGPGVHAPVTADELAQLESPEPEKKVPFWKREIGGKKKDKAPKPKPEPVAEAAPAADGEKKVPFWKKEIGGKKDKAPKPKAERAPKAPKEPKEKKPKLPKAPKVKAARGSRGAKRITGLKVGASQLAAARVANNGSAELLQIARTPLEPGIVVGGELRDPDALAEALKEFFSANNLPKKGVRLGIANNRIGVRTFDIAGIDDEKQLANAIRFRAQEALPIPIDEAVLDYQVLGDGISEDGRPTKRVLLVVAYRELIDRYMDACKKAGISLMGIDLEAFALLRALQAPQEGAEADSALVAVAIGHDRSTFAVSDGRICEFTRVLEWGGGALNVAIARALDAAPSEVDGVKRALALTDEMVPESLTPEQAQKAREAMRRAIQTFARELVSSLQYYQNQPGSLGIGEIVLTGGTAHLSGLAGELERLIGVRVRVGDPLGRMKVSKKVGEAEQVGSLAVAIGLGIED
jgi:type IV pilus assembly protein PilM